VSVTIRFVVSEDRAAPWAGGSGISPEDTTLIRKPAMTGYRVAAVPDPMDENRIPLARYPRVAGFFDTEERPRDEKGIFGRNRHWYHTFCRSRHSYNYRVT